MLLTEDHACSGPLSARQALMRSSSVRRILGLRPERSSSSTPITRMPAQPSKSERSRRPNRGRADQTGADPSASSCAMADSHRPRSDTHSLSRTPPWPRRPQGQCQSLGHVQPHLVVGDVEARQGIVPSCRDESTACTSPAQPPDGSKNARRRWGRSSGRATPSFGPSPSAQSHPDCRWSLTLIAAAPSG